ncbi:hypothetical protein [Mycobacterium sp. NAZ190054]|uniref:hypothetical protein n=1 Tax=Mycobacterium sp. NAZ190054 TaxID=1747766 RepID=UPI000799BE43|nr:hypothetical protein [Mycobacterium sp. NAZ190054]KWX62488.1 hypothetical protein ASJ79_08655 [Mycobacterium sp. NAZ190054]
MSNGKLALAAGIGAGYLLGRTRKMRWALMLAGAGITGKFPTHPSDLMAHGLKTLNASTDLGQLTEQLRGELVTAARAAAVSAAVSQVDALNNRLQGVTSAAGVDDTLEQVGGAADGVGDAVSDLGGAVGGAGSRSRGRSRAADDVDDYGDDTQVEDDDQDERPDLDAEDRDDEEDRDEDFDDVDEDEGLDSDEPEEEPEPPVTRRRAARRPSVPQKSARTPRRPAARSAARQGR